MTRNTPVAAALIALAMSASALATPAAAQDSDPTLRVLTFNVWHGLRSGESNKRFPGEDDERRAERHAWQIEEFKRLDPDVVLFQEVNPAQPLARWYAEQLGYDYINKTTSCGVHLGGIFKIPSNMNEGLAILAKPEYGLQRSGKKRLSGNAKCSATWGIQTKESRYALFGEINVGGRKVLLTTTHLSSPAFLLPDFEKNLDQVVEDRVLTAEQRAEILAARDRKEERNLAEVKGILAQVDSRRARLAGAGGSVTVILGGDFNAQPDSAGVQAVTAAGFQHIGGEPEFSTWNPLTNHANYEIGTRRHDSLPNFDKPEVSALYAPRSENARQIDHIFVSDGIEVVSAEMVLDQAKDGIYPSDHFGILATVKLP